jgi:ribosomal protein L11 methylase PrmA
LIEKAESRLILSGILKTQEREMMGAIAACGNFAHDVRTDGEWIAVILDV